MSNLQFSCDLPINGVSFGQVSIAILREMHKRDLHPHIFPISGRADLKGQFADPEFEKWLGACMQSAPTKHSRKNRSIRLFHAFDCLSSYSNESNDLITFHELDQLTPLEINQLKQQRRVYVTTRFTQSVFSQFGIAAHYLPLGFDAANFTPLVKRPKIDGVIQFLMVGKWEKRKAHAQMLRAWVKRYGNKKEYRLNLAITNPFMKQEELNAEIGQALEGKAVGNLNFLSWAPTNADYSVTLQSSDIVLACSGGEGWDLPTFHATAMGAWPVVMKAHAYLDFMTDENAIMVTPNGKVPAVDNRFFHANAPVNQGNLFTVSDEDFDAGMVEAERRVKEIGLNTKGLELQKMTYAQTVDVLLAGLAGD